MGSKPNTEVTKESLQDAQNMWGGFTSLVKYSSVAIALVLLMMLAFVY